MRSLILILILLPNFLLAGDLVPKGWVNDYANLLSVSERDSLEKQLSNFEKTTDIEVSIVTVTSLEGMDIESFANSLFKKWGVGKREKNNGILVVIAPNERKWRIEIGYGLEPYLTDYQSHEIGEDNFNHNFKNGDYGKGITAFSSELCSHLGSSTWQDREAAREKEKAESEAALSAFLQGLGQFFMWLIGLAVTSFTFIRFRKKLRERREFESRKERIIATHRESIAHTNKGLNIHRADEVSEDHETLELISKAKTEADLCSLESELFNYEQSTSDMLKLLNSVAHQRAETSDALKKLNKLEEKFNLKTTSHSTNSFEKSNSRDSLNTELRRLSGLDSQYSNRIDEINKWQNNLAIEKTPEDIDALIESNIKALAGKKWIASQQDIEKLRSGAISAFENLRSSSTSWEDRDIRDQAYSKFSKSFSEIIRYFDSIHQSNEHYAKMERIVKSSKPRISEFSTELQKLKSDKHNSNLICSEIDALLIILAAYALTNSVEKDYANYLKLERSTEELISKSKSEIERKKRKIREEKEEEERAERRRRESSSSYGYSSSSWSSSSSSDSGSSWDGFGGGDSGGGGSSGSW